MQAELTLPALTSEAELVLEWRIEELVRAGFPGEQAFELAAASQVDLHAALDLLARGCPPETAARILL
jgi:hypothetical protein